MRTLISAAPENDNIYTIFVCDADGSFFGTIDLKELIIARSDKPLEELIYTTYPYVYDKESISDNIERLRGYSEDIVPVLSTNGNKLIGVITSKDIIEIVDAERGDDYAKLAALSSEEESDEGIFKSMRKRIPWLVTLLFLGLAVSAVVGLFEGVVKELPLIVSFQSLILGMAGNVGTQSLAVTVRALGTEEMSTGEQIKLIFKETRVAFVNGLVIGLFSVLIVGGYLSLIGGYSVWMSFTTAACVGAALWFAMMISGLTGASIPMLFYKLGIDPAIASGPLITTVNDLVAVISYYGLAWGLLIQLGLGIV
jgi:magnesium transporter